jgi:hypothetical protein
MAFLESLANDERQDQIAYRGLIERAVHNDDLSDADRKKLYVVAGALGFSRQDIIRHFQFMKFHAELGGSIEQRRAELQQACTDARNAKVAKEREFPIGAARHALQRTTPETAARKRASDELDNLIKQQREALAPLQAKQDEAEAALTDFDVRVKEFQELAAQAPAWLLSA